MKKTFLKFAENRIANLSKRKNALSAEDAELVQSTIEELQSLVDEMKALPDEKTAEDVLKEFKSKVEEQITALNEKITEQPSAQVANYLGSHNACHDFLQAIRVSKSVNEFRSLWGAKLSENGITFASGSPSLPTEVQNAFTDAWNRPENWLRDLKNTGAKRMKIFVNGEDQDDEDSRAKGHTAGNTKAAQAIEFTGKEVACQYIYKIMPIDRIVEYEDDGALLKYITEELFSQWIYEVQRAILVGDGRTSSSQHKIISVEDCASKGVAVTYEAGDELIVKIMAMTEKLDPNSRNSILFVNRATANQLRKVTFGEGTTTQYVPLQTIAEQLNVSKIVTVSSDWLENFDGETEGAVAILLASDKYLTVGAMEPAFTSWEDGYKNQTVYRMEAPFGGALMTSSAAVVLSLATEDEE